MSHHDRASRRRPLLGTILVGGALCLLGCEKLKEKAVRDFPVSSPSEAPSAGAKAASKDFIITQGKVLPQYFMRSEWRAPSASRTTGLQRWNSRGVVPIVDESWKEGDPIPLWASGAWLNYPKDEWEQLRPKREAEERAWVESLRTALAKGPVRGVVCQIVDQKKGEGSAEHKAIAKAEQEYGIKSHPQAPVISWSTGDRE